MTSKLVGKIVSIFETQSLSVDGRAEGFDDDVEGFGDDVEGSNGIGLFTGKR